MAGAAGSIWVEGTSLHYISEYGIELSATGVDYGLVAGVSGSIWIESSWLAYIDSSQHKRLLDMGTIGTVAGANGSTWVEGEWVHYITGTTERYWHSDLYSDTVHSDWSDSASPHSDTAHSNWSDVPNNHGDWSDHGNWTDYGDHSDVAYSDSPITVEPSIAMKLHDLSQHNNSTTTYVLGLSLTLPQDINGELHVEYDARCENAITGASGYSYFTVNGIWWGASYYAAGGIWFTIVVNINKPTWLAGDLLEIWHKIDNSTPGEWSSVRNLDVGYNIITPHSDTAHSDWTDSLDPHSDWSDYADWSDSASPHSDTAHSNWSDSPAAHQDAAHTDSYADKPS